MPKSLAERQRDYRKNRLIAGDNGEWCLNTWVTTAAYLALEKLVARNGLTIRAMLESLVLEADQEIRDTLELDSKEWINTTKLLRNDYFHREESRYFCESLFWASKPKQAAKT